MFISYSWLKSYIPEIPKPEVVEDLIIFHVCEIEDTEKLQNGDTIFDLKILPDRAHDLLSHQGVAREIASLLGLEFKLPEYKIPNSKNTNLQIEIQTENCGRYMGRIVRNIKVEPSPEWMVKYLEAIGQRSINNIVDATNIVLFDCGQPIHAFDLKKISHPLALAGSPHQAGGEEIRIVVRNAKDGDTLELVGSEKLKASLKETDVVVTDGEKNLAIAGVKGGLDSGISDTTTDILIEVANFNAVSVRKTARRLGIQSDASKRFENDLSSILCDFAMNEISALILEMCSTAKFEEIKDVYNNKPEVKKISFTTSYISKSLGVKITEDEIEKILKNYHYEFSHKSDLWQIVVPFMRLDITGAHDMVEEIGRVYGYGKINSQIPSAPSGQQDNLTWVKICLAKQKLVQDGYKEVMNYVFRDNGEVEVLASASDKKFLRTNLSDGLKESIKLNTTNLPLLDADEVKVFEVGAIFTKDGEEIRVAYGDKKEIKEMSLEEFIEGEHLENYEELFFLRRSSHFSRKKVLPLESPRQDLEERKIFKPWSVYPFMVRDIAVWVPQGVEPEILVDIYKSFGTELLMKEPKLFDSFTKNDKTSFAYRLVFQSNDRTLTDEEINEIMLNITLKIKSLGFEVR